MEVKDNIKNWVDNLDVKRPFCQNHNNALLEIDIKSGDRFCA